MKEKINIIKANLTGDFEKDIQDLYTLAQDKQKELEDGIETLNAINSVIEELENTKTNEVVEEVDENNENVEESLEETSDGFDVQKQEQINSMIAELTQDLQNGDIDEALTGAEGVIAEVEELSKSDDNTKIYCSCSSDFEKSMMKYVFAGDKEVVDTPYSNDVLYTVYSDILLAKKKTKAAMDALDRAIYWNFLSRDARSKKIDLYYRRNEIVKCLDAIKKLQSISYTAQDLSECYNKYAFVFESLKDPKSAYALYVVSYYYVNDENVLAELNRLAEQNPELADMTLEEAFQLAKDNEVNVNPNNRIVGAYRNIIKDYIESGDIDFALTLVENDYAITRDEQLNEVYTSLVDLKEQQEESQETEEVVEEEPAAEEKPKKTATKKTTAKKTATKKTTTTKKKTTKKSTKKAEDKE
ncbi:MAG: hypothetical protein IKD74_00935 [Clostridia bacterium]|nr:hypothetical protein [Clostridia bacterium]